MSLKQKTYSAGRWTAGATLFKTGLQLIQVVILAHLLAPADFGLMAIVGSILTVLGLFSDLGLSRAIVHFENIPTNSLHSLYWLNLITGLVLSLVFAISAPAFGWVFSIDGLPKALIAISPYFFLSALGQQFYALAEKDLRFSALAINEVIAATTGFAFAVAIALNGGKVYALVGGALASTTVGSLLAWKQLSAGYRPRLHLNFLEARPYLKYGSYLIGENLLNTLQRQSDVFIAGLIASPATLGLFTVPRDLNLRIGMIVNPIITRVGFPVMSRLQNDTANVRSVYMQTLRMTASTNFPIYIVLGLFSNEIVALLYGQQWEGATTYLRVLAIWGLLRSTYNPIGSLLHAMGAMRLSFWWNVALFFVVPPFYWVAANLWKLPGLAISMVLVQLILFPLIWAFLVRPTCGAKFSEYLQQILTPLILSLIAGTIATLATFKIEHGILKILVGCLIGGLAYLVLSRTFNRQWFDAIWTFLQLPHPNNTRANS